MKFSFFARLAALWAALALGLSGCGARTPPPLVLPGDGTPVTLYVATDLHYISPRLTDDGGAFYRATYGGDGKQLDRIPQITDAFVAQVLRERPDALLLTGDLTLNGEKQSHRELADKLSAIRESGIPVLALPGNHDINNSHASGYKGEKIYGTKTVTPQEFDGLYAPLGPEAASRDTDSLSSLVKLSGDLWLLLLDTNKYDQKGGLAFPETSGALRDSTWTWAEDCLREAREAGATVIAAMHHNLTIHNQLIHEGYVVDDSQRLASLLSRYGVPLVLSGHVHIQSITRAGTLPEVYDVATSSMAVYTNQFGVVELRPGEALSYRVREVDVEDWAAENAPGDPVLTGFEAASYDFFRACSYNRAMFNLFDNPDITDDEFYLLCNTMADLNPYYFSGRAAEIRDQVMASDHYALWLEKGILVDRDYIESMLALPELSPLALDIPLAG